MGHPWIRWWTMIFNSQHSHWHVSSLFRHTYTSHCWFHPYDYCFNPKKVSIKSTMNGCDWYKWMVYIHHHVIRHLWLTSPIMVVRFFCHHYTYITYGGFLKLTPSHPFHPFIDGIFPYKSYGCHPARLRGSMTSWKAPWTKDSQVASLASL